MLSHSRYRRAARMDGVALALLLALITAIGVIAAPVARAEPSTRALEYAALFGDVVCDVLDDHATISGLIGIGEAITDDGLSYHEAGEVLAISVTEICPRHYLLLKRFVRLYGGEGMVA